MKRVTGIGGIFFKAKDAPALQAWYKRHLGIDVQQWGGTAFTWTDGEGKPVAGTTVGPLALRKVTSLRPARQRSWSITNLRPTRATGTLPLSPSEIPTNEDPLRINNAHPSRRS
jgi:hypothetical protein